MSNLDTDPVEWNTAERRTELTNAPPSVRDFTFESYEALGRAVPPVLRTWILQTCRPGVPRTSLLLYGAPGVGKTVLGACALRALAAAGVGSTFYWNMVTSPGVQAAISKRSFMQKPSPVWFERTSRILARQSREAWDEEAWFAQLEQRVTVLFLDDITVWGSSGANAALREAVLLRHLEWAEDSPDRALILTLNETPEQLIRENILTPRVVDRLQEHRRFEHAHLKGERFGEAERDGARVFDRWVGQVGTLHSRHRAGHRVLDPVP